MAFKEIPGPTTPSCGEVEFLGYALGQVGITVTVGGHIYGACSRWVGVGRELRDRDDRLLKILDSNITALAPMGDRLLVGLADLGLVVVDPGMDFQVLSRLPLAETVSRPRINGDRLLAVVGKRYRWRAIHRYPPGFRALAGI